MKKMSFVLLILVLLTACENPVKEDNMNCSLLESFDIGKVHNQILAYYSGKTSGSFNSGEAISLVENYLVSVKQYNDITVEKSIQEITSTTEYDLMFNSKSTGEEMNMNAYFEAITKYFNPSDEIMASFRHAFFIGESGDPEEVREFVINNIQEKKWKGNDRELAYVFTDVFLHSYDYWTSTQTDKKKLKKSSLVILYDAGGALHGLIFGPDGSIIEGALLSVAANETIPDDKLSK
jgi:hypothetical protein